MPKVPTTSPATGLPVHPDFVHTTSLNFVDNHGRTLLLRGVNLSGASKAPVGQLSYQSDDFWESAERGDVSFIGRPLNIDDGSADVHLARLRGWGFNLLRFPFTWEALEHEGPGKYDYEFMDYTIQVLCKCREYGFRVYMDPHQDTWSRFSGGSGAPYWTLAACGINPLNITATQAAIIHSEYPLAHSPDPSSLPAMIWSTNYGRLLSQTVFTLFFAGRDFTPKCIIDGVNIQDFLQNHFIEACGQLADRIRQFDNGSLFEETIIGWDSMNEPFEGLCGWDNLNANPTKQGSTLKKGTYPTPAQSLRLGMGQAQTVDNWTFGGTGPRQDGTVTIDPKGYKVWAEEDIEDEDGTHPRWGWKRDTKSWKLGTCPWAEHGVWDIETGFVLRPDYFRYRPASGPGVVEGKEEMVEVEFLSDYWKPHWLAYAARIRVAQPEAIIFVQPPVFAPPPRMTEEEVKGRCAYSPHYYDGLTLVSRHWNWFNADALGLLRGKYRGTLGAVKIGETAIRKSLQEQIGYLQDDVVVLGTDSEEHEESGAKGVLEDMQTDVPAGSSMGVGSGAAGATAAVPTFSVATAAEAVGAGVAAVGETVTNLNMTTYPGQHPTLESSLLGKGKYPTLLGEIGTPFDMDNKRSYGYTDKGKYLGDYSGQEKALDASLNACDGARACNWTVWTYVGDDHTHEWGDGWNLEDLSLWSWDDYVGGEGEKGAVVAGRPRGRVMGRIAHEEEMNSRAGLLARVDEDRDDEEESRGRSTSRPTLTQNQPEAMRMTMGPSALSLGTLGADTQNQKRLKKKQSAGTLSSISSSLHSPSTSASVSPTRPAALSSSKTLIKNGHPYDGTRGYALNPYVFLTNGARAVRAFARPWPVKVVGRPVDVKFELGKALFKLAIEVGEEDARPSGVGQDADGRSRRSGRTARSTGTKGADVRVAEVDEDDEDDGGKWDERKATEIYIPLVHYAHQGVVDDALRTFAAARSHRHGRKEAHVEADANTIVGVETEPAKDATVLTLGSSAEAEGSERTLGRPESVVAPCSVPDVYLPSSSSYKDAVDTPSVDALPLIDIEVKVSTGYFKISGQRLLWWYEVPKPGEPSEKVEVEVRRRGGALRGVPDWRKVRGAKEDGRSVDAASVYTKEANWCEKLCDESGPCVVM